VSRIKIWNERDCPVTVWSEPWGRDYTLLAGEQLEFAALSPGADFYFQVDWH
jgi:hypothetical protein